VFFSSQVNSNTSTGLENSAQGVYNTPPFLIFGDLLTLVGLVGKEVFNFKKILPWKTGSITT
jgi:hypothetical protein